MANGDTKTEALLNILGNGGDSSAYRGCCNTKTQSYILDAIDRVESVEEEVEELKNNPDVVDIVATYADLQAYDKSSLTDKDIIRVLADETHDGDSTYYRYSKSSDSFTYIGESKQYTAFVGTDGTTAGTAGLVPAPATTDAGKVLGANGNWVTGGPTVVQTVGNSQTDVMSQDATTKMVFTSSSKHQIRIGSGGNASGQYSTSIGEATESSMNYGIAIGALATANKPTSSSQEISSIAIGNAARSTGGGSIAIGGYDGSSNNSLATGKGAVAIGVGSEAYSQGQFDISSRVTSFGYNNSNYRLLTGLYDPQNAHDAATKGYVDGLVGDVAAALNAINNGGGN